MYDVVEAEQRLAADDGHHATLDEVEAWLDELDPATTPATKIRDLTLKEIDVMGPKPWDQTVVRGALSCVQRVLAGYDLTNGAGDCEGWCWITEHADLEALRSAAETGDLVTRTEVVPITEDEAAAMTYVHENGVPD
jgi:hypothetical protein